MNFYVFSWKRNFAFQKLLPSYLISLFNFFSNHEIRNLCIFIFLVPFSFCAKRMTRKLYPSIFSTLFSSSIDNVIASIVSWRKSGSINFSIAKKWIDGCFTCCATSWNLVSKKLHIATYVSPVKGSINFPPLWIFLLFHFTFVLSFIYSNCSANYLHTIRLITELKEKEEE